MDQRLGYRVRRIPPLVSEPGYALEPDFDFVLAHYLGHRASTEPPFVVEVGAADGVIADRLHKYLRTGEWRGILVEPQTSSFDQLVKTYAGVDGLELVNAAIDKRAGVRALYCFVDASGEPIEALSVFASFSRARLLEWERTDGLGQRRIGSVPVACTTFDERLAGVDFVDVLQLDVEGYDLELLKLFDFVRFRPPIVRFEHAHLSQADWDSAVQLLAKHGYRMLREKIDTIAYLFPPDQGAYPAPSLGTVTK